MQQQYYNKEQLEQLIDKTDLNVAAIQLKQLSERRVVRETNREYKLQDEIIREQYQQSHQYQEKMLNTYRKLQNLDDHHQVSQFLLSQFEDDQLVIQNTAEQCIEWFYRTDKLDYITVIVEIFEKFNEFQEAVQKKIMKDVKIQHAKVYIAIKHLTPILEPLFLTDIYQYLLLHYCFCYVYDFQNSDTIIKAIYQLTHPHLIVESQFLVSIYEQRSVVFKELFNLSNNELLDCIHYTKQYLTPKLQFNHMFVDRVNKEYVVQPINIVESLKIEITAAFDYIQINPLVETFISTIILNQRDLAKFIIEQFMDKLIIEKSNKILQTLVNLITNSELKSLFYQNNKKKPLMREILSLSVEERFQTALLNKEVQISTFRILSDLYKNGLISKILLLGYAKQSLKFLFTTISKKEIINIEDCVLFKSLQILQSSVESSNKVKDHELLSIQKVVKKAIFDQQFNWFDIDNLITFETLNTILQNILITYK